MKTIYILLISFVLSLQAQAGLLFVYSRLATKDLDQMNKIVQDKIKESRKEKADKSIPLKEALQAVFSRPNDDFMIEKIIGPLKSELEENNAWEHTINTLVKEATGALKNPKAFHADAQVTYIVFLENLVAEFRPKANENFERGVLMTIKKANIQVTKEAQAERQLRMMKQSQSPSELAEAVLTPPPTTTTVTPTTIESSD